MFNSAHYNYLYTITVSHRVYARKIERLVQVYSVWQWCGTISFACNKLCIIDVYSNRDMLRHNNNVTSHVEKNWRYLNTYILIKGSIF